jgi:hypothetical protein
LNVYDLRKAGSSSDGSSEVIVGGGVVSSGGRVNDVEFLANSSDGGTYGSEYIVYSTSKGEIGATLARGNVAAARSLHVEESSGVLGLSSVGQHIFWDFKPRNACSRANVNLVIMEEDDPVYQLASLPTSSN